MTLIERSRGDFFRQKVTTSVHQDRLIFFNEVTAGKTVLHYGCADWPIYDVNYNLHYRMCQVSDAVDGFVSVFILAAKLGADARKQIRRLRTLICISTLKQRQS